MTEGPRHRSHRARAALAHLPEVDPALASLALWCEIRDGKDAQTCTSGDVIHVGSSFERLSVQEQIGLIGRHVLHIALRHELALRDMLARWGGAFRLELHALCCSAIVNEYLVRAGHALPRPAVLLSDLLDAVQDETLKSTPDPLAHMTSDTLYLRLMGNDSQTLEHAENYAREKAYHPDIHPDRPDVLAERKAPEWRARLIRAYQAGGGSGRGVGSVLRNAQITGQSRTPWEKRLRGLVARAVFHKPRQSFRRPRAAWIARDADACDRNVPRPVFEPAQLRQHFRPRIVVGVDTSGSVTREILAIFANEVLAIARKTGAETHVLFFDEEVYADMTLEAYQPPSTLERIPLRRDGGTSFVQLMTEADALSPSVVIVLTDGAGPFGQPPASRVIWASPKPLPAPPPFGEVLNLSW
ncbi:MAG: VWA-like domain-containing protein [Pseudomonadota bacterium]